MGVQLFCKISFVPSNLTEPESSKIKPWDRVKDYIKPVKPTKVKEPVVPVKPSKPEKPSKPAEPAKPSKPAEPAKPNKPSALQEKYKKEIQKGNPSIHISI